MAGDVDNVVPSHGYSMQPVVGIGGSAGSVPALQSFFEGTPPDTGLAFVFILHLSPEHESMLAAVLQRNTEMPVLQVLDRVKVEPNHVYVIPPGKFLAMSDGHILLTDVHHPRGNALRSTSS